MTVTPSGFSGTIGSERQALRDAWAASGLHSARNIADRIADTIGENDGKFVFEIDGERTELTAKTLDREARLVASALAESGIEIGDVVALQLPNGPEAMSVLLGIIYAGAVALPIVPFYGSKEIGFILRQSQAKAIFLPTRWNKIDYPASLAKAGDLPHLGLIVAVGSPPPSGALGWAEFRGRGLESYSLPSLSPSAACLLLYTSGTTSDPKGVLHTHRTIQALMRNMQAPQRGDTPYRSVASPSTGHIGHVMQMLLVAMIGGDVITMDRWSAAVGARLIHDYRPTRMDAAPVFLYTMIDVAREEKLDLSSLTEVKLGGTAIMPSDIIAWDKRGICGFRSYGSTEHPLATGSWPGDPLDMRATSDGSASAGTRIRILDDEGSDVPAGQPGEIALIGPQQFIGYLDPALNGEQFLPGGWFLTGDVGVLNSNGTLIITDRKKDIIIRGGENISAKEIEESMSELAWISECAAVAMPDARLGEKVCIFAIVNDEAAATFDAMVEHFRLTGIARQKIPEKLILVDAFPRTPSGKIKKFELRELVP
jgi:cyclohexanecarboxylate-CoA ligase